MSDSSINLPEHLVARRKLLDDVGAQCADELKQIVDAVIRCVRAGGTVFACGNGGSASQAEHFSAELVGRFKKDRRALRAYALSVNTPILTAIANDFSFRRIFSRQLEGMGRAGDCLLALSTSGSSDNVVEACKTARAMGIAVFTLTGRDGGAVASEGDVALKVPHTDTPLIQEIHLTMLHLICQCVEDDLFSVEDRPSCRERPPAQ